MLKGKTLTDHTITKAIEDSFKQITANNIRSLIHHVIEKVYPKVFNGDTI